MASARGLVPQLDSVTFLAGEVSPTTTSPKSTSAGSRHSLAPSPCAVRCRSTGAVAGSSALTLMVPVRAPMADGLKTTAAWPVLWEGSTMWKLGGSTAKSAGSPAAGRSPSTMRSTGPTLVSCTRRRTMVAPTGPAPSSMSRSRTVAEEQRSSGAPVSVPEPTEAMQTCSAPRVPRAVTLRFTRGRLGSSLPMVSTSLRSPAAAALTSRVIRRQPATSMLFGSAELPEQGARTLAMEKSVPF